MPPRYATANAGARVTGSEAGTPESELLVRRSVSHPARATPRAISGSARRRAVRRANLNRYVIAEILSEMGGVAHRGSRWADAGGPAGGSSGDLTRGLRPGP